MSSPSASTLAPVERKGILVLHRSGLPITFAPAGTNAIEKASKQPAVYIFLSGFPDKSTTFENFAKRFEDNHHVVRISYPGMDEEELGSFWGYSLREVELALVSVIMEYRDKHNCEIIYLHGFDWGAFVGLFVAQHHPTILTKLIQQDIGIIYPAELPLYDLLAISSYQIFLAFVFLVSRVLCLGNDKLAARALWFLPYCFPWFVIMTNVPKHILPQMLPHRCYPYLRFIVDTMMGRIEDLEFSPTVPQFFAYGDKKHVSFHTQGYVNKVKATSKCRYKVYTGGSHWFHISHEQEFQNDILQFLQE